VPCIRTFFNSLLTSCTAGKDLDGFGKDVFGHIGPIAAVG